MPDETRDISDSEQWLKQNQSLRMDANSELFPADRRSFHLARYAFAEPFCSGLEVLDGACGTGYGTARLANSARRAVGIDCSQDSIAYARKVYARENIEFVCSYVEHTAFDDDRFDAVVSFETVEHTLCPRAHMMEIVRVLKPTGKAILSVPNAWGYTDHHFFDFDFSQLQALVGGFFAKTRFFAQNPATSDASAILPLESGASAADSQCIVAICEEPRKESVVEDRYGFVMNEIYANAFTRHNEFRTLLYRQQTSLLQRSLNKLRTMLG